jgi:hypothetical protein
MWTGAVSSNGSPVISFTHETAQVASVIRVRRLMYTLYHGKLDGSMEISMTCAHTLCVNPQHMELILGIESLDMRDFGVYSKIPLGMLPGDFEAQMTE